MVYNFLEILLCGAYKGGAYKTRLREHSISSNFTTNLTSIVPLVITSVVAQHYKLKHIQIQLICRTKVLRYCYSFQEFSSLTAIIQCCFHKSIKQVYEVSFFPYRSMAHDLFGKIKRNHYKVQSNRLEH